MVGGVKGGGVCVKIGGVVECYVGSFRFVEFVEDYVDGDIFDEFWVEVGVGVEGGFEDGG